MRWVVSADEWRFRRLMERKGLLSLSSLTEVLVLVDRSCRISSVGHWRGLPFGSSG